jgi:GSH-dependent disulfide-bond oxidoreductase
MIDLHYWTTPNGHKITIALEELGVEYRILPVNISAGEQFRPEFLRIGPNNRIPAIVDHDPQMGGDPLSVFESGAILEYLADKTGRLLPSETRARFETLQWLYWQMAGLGPMAGQNHHFTHYAPERIAYATQRYQKETGRLYHVLDERLRDREYITDAFSIADIACYPWVRMHARQAQDLADFPQVHRWLDSMSRRPAVVSAYRIAETINTTPTVTESAREHLFGQQEKTPRRAGGYA